MSRSSTRTGSRPPTGDGGMTDPQRRDAEVRRSRGETAWGASEAEDAGCWPAVAVVAVADRRRGRDVQCEQATPAAQEPPANTAQVERGRALGDGLPGRDPDLPGAIGRLAVLRDQPGPRDLHRAARRAATRSTAATCSTGWTTTRCCCCVARSRPTATCTTAMQGNDVRQLNRNLHTLGYDADGVDRPDDTLHGRRRRSSAPARQGLRRDRSARSRRCGLPARAGADRQGDRRARWIRPAGCTGRCRPHPTRSRCRWTSRRRSRAR